MRSSELREAIQPTLEAFINVPLILADQVGNKPEGPHATFKFTTPFAKGIGRAEETIEQTPQGVQIKRVEEYRTTLSFTAYAMDNDESMDLAQQIHDWFSFDGYEFLDKLGIVIAEQTDVINRDAFIVENYERRNGFDVILKVMREKTRDSAYFNNIAGITP